MLRNLLVLIIGTCLVACGGSTKEGNSDGIDSTAMNEEPKVEEVGAVSIWDKVSVRASASDEGKWLTSLSLGETMTYLGEEETNDQDKTFLKIRLNDGTQGWSRAEFVIPQSDPAVFVNDTDIYDRPDLLTKSKYQFSKMDIVAVKQTNEDEWAEIIGKPSGEKWLKSGWVKVSNLSFDQVDIAMAKFAKPIIDTDNSPEKAEKLQEILNNQDLTASTFTPDIKDALDQIMLSGDMNMTEEADSVSSEE